MTTLPEEAVKAAEAEFTAYFVRNYPGPDTVIHKPEWHAPKIFRAALHAIRNRVFPILSALEPSAARELALEEGDLQELLERLDAGLDYEGELETENDHIELFNVEAAQDLFADAAAAIRALSSPDHADAGKVEGEGIERAKFYHHQWPMERLLEARRDGLVDHSGGEAWRYEYSHRDENGKYDVLYRPVKNSTIPSLLPSAPSEGVE